jgi:cytochrome d ubiquinol oxidase subunit II
VALLVAIAIGAAILFPSLGLLFGLLLRGRFDPAEAQADTQPREPTPREPTPQEPTPRTLLSASSNGLRARLSLAGLLGGLGLLTAAEAPWAHALGVVSLFACTIFAFLAVDPLELARAEDGA